MRCLAAVALLAALATPAAAEPGDVVYVKDGVLIRAPVLQKGEAVTLATLPEPLATPDRIAVSPDGRTLVIAAGDHRAWLDLEATAPALRTLVCGGRLTLGTNTTCASGTGYTLVTDLRAGTHRAINAEPGGARVVGTALYHAAGGKLWKLDLTTGARTAVADHVPDASLLFAPDGSRAIGVYGTGDDAGLYSFRLDGTAAKRKLMRKARPLAWSADSRWLLVQQGKNACIVRAVGGEYKCWRRYQAIALAPDGSWAVVARPADDGKVDLRRAELEGPDPKRPHEIVSAAVPAAAWLP